MESCSRIRDGKGRLAQGEDEVRRIWKEYFEDLYNIDTVLRKRLQSTCMALMGQRGNYFRGESIGRAEVEMRVG